MSALSRSEPYPDYVTRFADRSWIVGLIALVPCLALLFVPQSRGLMYPAYLIGFVFWFGIAMGGASLTMLHHLTGGSWGLLVRRPMEAAALVTAPLALLFLPIPFGLDVLYPWARQLGAEDLFAHEIESLCSETIFFLRESGTLP